MQYQGTFAAGSIFTFTFDYGAVTASLQTDTIGIAIATPVPESGALSVLGAAGAALACLHARRARAQRRT